jgi:hypothetical protein
MSLSIIDLRETSNIRAPTISAARRSSSHGKPDPAVGSVCSELFLIVIVGVVADLEPLEPAASG